MTENKIYIAEIPLKLISLNEYVNLCRGNRYASANYKKSIQKQIANYIKDLPVFHNPVHINFIWVEANKKRDYDNIAFGKKFILDTLVKLGKLKDDNRKCVVGFTDNFKYSNEYKIILEIKERIND